MTRLVGSAFVGPDDRGSGALDPLDRDGPDLDRISRLLSFSLYRCPCISYLGDRTLGVVLPMPENPPLPPAPVGPNLDLVAADQTSPQLAERLAIVGGLPGLELVSLFPTTQPTNQSADMRTKMHDITRKVSVKHWTRGCPAPLGRFFVTEPLSVPYKRWLVDFLQDAWIAFFMAVSGHCDLPCDGRK